MSERALAYIAEILKLEPIPNADKIEKATILGWEVVVQKGQFNVDDKVIYIEIDSIFPNLPPFAFLSQKKFRIKTQKIRGQISQGIAFPLSVINEVNPLDTSTFKVGDNVTDILGITKYDPEQSLDTEVEPEPVKKSWLAKKLSYYKWKLFGFKPTKSDSFPSNLVPKTDETRVQKMGSALHDRAGQMMYITEKCEGTSGTFVYKKSTANWLGKLFGVGDSFLICSRNRIILNSQKGGDSTHHIVQVAKKYDLYNKMKKLNRNLAIQAEIIGPKIQANIYKLPELDMRAFLIYDIDAQTYLPYEQTVSLLQELEIPMVPVLDSFHQLQNDIKYYVELSKGQSALNPGVRREGVVVRSLDENFSFKSINPEYLLASEL